MCSTNCSCQILINFAFSGQIFGKYPDINFTKNPPLGDELFHADGRTDGQTDKQTEDMTKLIVVFEILRKRLKRLHFLACRKSYHIKYQEGHMSATLQDFRHRMALKLTSTLGHYLCIWRYIAYAALGQFISLIVAWITSGTIRLLQAPLYDFVRVRPFISLCKVSHG
jgi:hypothetical protein